MPSGKIEGFISSTVLFPVSLGFGGRRINNNPKTAKKNQINAKYLYIFGTLIIKYVRNLRFHKLLFQNNDL
jgi:hypothetical protein